MDMEMVTDKSELEQLGKKSPKIVLSAMEV